MNVKMVVVTSCLAVLSGCCCGEPLTEAEIENNRIEAKKLGKKRDAAKKKRAEEDALEREQAQKEEMASAIKIGARALDAEYEKNEVKADLKYKGKKLIVSGSVKSIDKDFLDNIVLQLKGKNQFMGIRATMEESEKAKAANLDRGNKIVLLCTGNGRLVGSASLKDCTLQ